MSVDFGTRGAGISVRALCEVSFELNRGQVLCLLGPSGCGKTTSLRLINRLLEPTSGKVLIDGAPVDEQDPIALRRRIGYVIQGSGLFPHMTVSQNVGILGRVEGWSAPQLRERTDELLEMVRLDPGRFAERYPSELSGGQQQRVGVARALALDPAIILMDEPFGALDPFTRSELQRDMLELIRATQKTVVLVTHDLREAFRMGDRVGVMSEGRLLRIGTSEEVRRDPGSELVARFLEEMPHEL